jgi:hypothetical protein
MLFTNFSSRNRQNLVDGAGLVINRNDSGKRYQILPQERGAQQESNKGGFSNEGMKNER